MRDLFAIAKFLFFNVVDPFSYINTLTKNIPVVTESKCITSAWALTTTD